MQSVLIFGAGINQIELIREAKKLGLTAIAIDPRLDPPGKKEANYFYCVNGIDYETTKAIAIKHEVDAIVTGQMEKPMRLMARLAQDLGLRYHSPEAVERSLDKWLMKQAFFKCKVPCARGILYGKGDAITPGSLQEFVFPLIIKPKDATSSQGVYRIARFEDIGQYIDITRSFAKTGEIIIEEFLDGPEYSVEAITYRGLTSIIQFTEKYVTPFPRTVEMGHLQPADLSDEQKKAITTIIDSAIKAIGIDNSASHTEVKLTSSGPKVIEIGARLGGDFIASYLTKASTGISMDRAAVQMAIGEEPDLKLTENRFSMIRYLELNLGMRVLEILPWNDLLHLPGVVFAQVFVCGGDVISPIIHSALRPACLLVEGSSREKVIQMMEAYMPKLRNKIRLIQ